MVKWKIFHRLSMLPLWLKIGFLVLFVICSIIVISLLASPKQAGYVFDTAKKTSLTEIVS